MISRHKAALRVCWRLHAGSCSATAPAKSIYTRRLYKLQPELLSAKWTRSKATATLVQPDTGDESKTVTANENRKSGFGLKQRLVSLTLLKDDDGTAMPASAAAAGEYSQSKRIFAYLEEISHMVEVRSAQNRVMRIKGELRDAGNKKRDILMELELLRTALHHTYKNMKFTDNRSSDQYLLLVKEEVELYTREKALQEAFTAADKREQFLFNEFSVAISDSYEKEKLHTNFVKVLGVIGTILGSFITLIATIVGILYNQSRFYTLRQDVESTLTNEVMQKLEEVLGKVSSSQHSPPESWGPYLKRHTRWMYSWAMPKT